MGISEMKSVAIGAVAIALCVLVAAHEDGPDKLSLHAEHFPRAEGSKAAIYQFQIDNNNQKSKRTSPVEFTAEISPDMDVENAYFFNEQSQSKPGVAAQKGKRKIGQRSSHSQKAIRKQFPGARITFPKLIRCNMKHIDDFATVYVHAKVGKNVKQIPVDDMIKASYSQNNELKQSIELPLVDPSREEEMFMDEETEADME